MPTLTTNSSAPINFAGTIWVVAPGAIAFDAGAFTSGSLSCLVNYGSIITQGAPGSVVFSIGGSGTLYNEPDGLINGPTAVAVTGGDGVTIRNRGDIFGVTEHGVHVAGSGNHATIVNGGEIFGHLGGVTVSAGTATDVVLRNSGEISSDQHGVWLLNAPGAAPVIINSGIIKGTVNAVLAEVGDRLDLTNTGQLIGDVRATSLNQADIVRNNGTIIGEVRLGSGNDTYIGAGSVSRFVFGDDGADVLTGGGAVDTFGGGAGNDTLSGNGGDDILDGITGNDMLLGGAGHDTMTGGFGNDIFRYLTKSDSGLGAAADVITDFDDFGNDVINLTALFGPTMSYRHNLAFTAAGQVRINDVAGPDVVVEVNTGGTLAADMQIVLRNTNLASMTASDFIL
ncbi:MAG TPA: calcium-binding protein [Beijerinckiaceae bacterium]|nr:calcium-binding protein [Beijerinckiaceae bacterium]